MGPKRFLFISTVLLSLLSFGRDDLQNPKADWEVLFRPRWEHVDVEDNSKRSANALTFRLAGSVFGRSQNWNWKLELTGVGVLYDRFSPQRENYEFVAEENRLRPTEFWFSYKNRLFGFKLGRFRIKIGDERFVGSVDWRQMPQTFDAAKFYIGGKGWKLDLYYLFGRHGVLNTLSTRPFDGNQPFNYSPLAVLSFEPFKGVGFTFHYLDLRKNSRTYGGEFSLKLRKVSLLFGLHGQRNKVQKRDSSFWRTRLSVPVKDFSFSLSFERFSKGFITPLATLHKFNGWGDLFLKYTASANNYGLTDLALGATYRSPFGRLGAFYHLFGSTERLPNFSKRFGEEVDLLYKVSLSKNLSLVLKGAHYTPRWKGCDLPYCRETSKVWFMLSYRLGGR